MLCQPDEEEEMQNSCYRHGRAIAEKLSQPGTPWDRGWLRTEVCFARQRRWKMCNVVINSLPELLKSFSLQPRDYGSSSISALIP